MTDPPKTWKEALLESRIAKYPLLSAAIVISILGFLWWLDPNFLRFLRGATPLGEP